MLVTASVRTGDPPTDAALLAEIANDPATAHVRPGPLSRGGRRRARGAPARRRARPRLPRGLPPHDRRQPAARPPAAERARDRRTSSPTPRTPTSCGRSARAPSRAPCCCGSRGCPARPPPWRAPSPCSARAPTCRRWPASPASTRPRSPGAMAALARAEILRPEPPPGLRAPARARRRLPGPPARASASCCTPAPPACCADAAPRSDQIAGQLMHTPRRGDAGVAQLLHDAGNAALARGAVDSSVGYLQRALDEPRAGVDPPAAAARPRPGRGADPRPAGAPCTCARPTTA